MQMNWQMELVNVANANANVHLVCTGRNKEKLKQKKEETTKLNTLDYLLEKALHTFRCKLRLQEILEGGC